MPFFVVIILDAIIIWFFFGNNIASWFRTQAGKVNFELKECSKLLAATLLRDRDRLSVADREYIQNLQAKIGQAKEPEERKTCLAELNSKGVQERLDRIRRNSRIRNWLEMVVVAMGVAFGIRALFIQPFKIPTGSMQPTLCGIHYEPQDSLPSNKWLKIFNLLNYSHTPIELTIQQSGTLEYDSFRPVASGVFSSKTAVVIGEVQYILPCDVDTAKRLLFTLCALEKKNVCFQEGEKVFFGTLNTGDHLFVNRLPLCYREPRRGDVMVFTTDGLKDPDGTGFGGRFYVKRLVGLPGDTLAIRQGGLYLKRPTDKEFQLVDEKIHPSFKKINSKQNGYKGYANMPGAMLLASEDDTFTVPDKEYFMLGDNTYNSKDSRYWGTVPRKNLVGMPCMVWYPFSKRFGLTDRN